MQLRSLLRSDRFAGSTNPRQLIPPFHKDQDRPLTLYCAESEAGLSLRLREHQHEVDMLTLPLPAYVIERIGVWNRWATYAQEHEYEYTPPLYGLEAYATAIAIDIARALPDRPVDYCGLPVHDDYALCLHVNDTPLRLYDADHRTPHAVCTLPPDITPNGHLKRLLTTTEHAPVSLPAHGFRGWGDFDYCCGYLHFDPAEKPYAWMGYEESFDSDEEHFPQWLRRLITEWENSLLDYKYHNMRWIPAFTLLCMQEDALAVDVARYHRPLVPIAMSERFYTGEDVLALAGRQKSVTC